MLVVTAVLLLVGVALLVTALVVGPVTLAWGSIAASVAAALALVARSWRQRRARRRRSTATATPPRPGPPQPGGSRAAALRRQPAEPAEEDTDAADVLLIHELADEVVVVDERPRYHLRGCRWVGSRPTEPLPVAEARQLGFTPCGGCGPDAELARRHRAQAT